VLAAAADRARRFLTSLQTLSEESLQLIYDEVRDLVRAYPARPLPELLSAVLGGLLAKASHDLADPHAALAQSRTAWLCAEQAAHDGLSAWISGLQALICYWASRPHDSIRYAQRGIPYASVLAAQQWYGCP
jgi:hypothetical protein